MLTENQVFANRYRLVKRLGQGAFSEVWKAEDTKANNMVMALKIYAPDKGMDEDGVQIFSGEFSLVFNVSHKNLLTPTYFDDFNGSPYLVLPFCEKGNAQKLVGKVDEEQVAKFLFDVSNALSFLHSQEPPIIHQDIKPENVLIDTAGLYRVTDFGISTNMRSTLRKSMGASHVNDNAGTMAYMGPERFNKNRETIKASDVWSLGAATFELMCGDVPFGDFGGLTQKNGADMPEIKGNYTNNLKQLVLACLALEPWDRPTAAQVCEICYQYIHNGFWDLSLIAKQSKPNTNGSSNKSRGTQRRVPNDLPQESKKQNSKSEGRNEPQVTHQSDGSPKDSKKTRKFLKPLIISLSSVAALVAIVVIIFWPTENKSFKKAVKTNTIESYTQYLEISKDQNNRNRVLHKLYDLLENDSQSIVENSQSCITKFESTWSDFGPIIDEMNNVWEKCKEFDENVYEVSQKKLLSFDEEEKLSEYKILIDNVRGRMSESIWKKKSSLEKNLDADPSNVGTKKDLDELTGYKGLDDKPMSSDKASDKGHRVTQPLNMMHSPNEP